MQVRRKLACLRKRREMLIKNKAKIHEKNKDESDVVKAPKKKQSSPVRPSKLPPVCLRVDPPPRTARTNGTSRSPSPPRQKDRSDHKKSEAPSRSQIERKDEIFEKVVPVVNVKPDNLSPAEKEKEFHGSVPVSTTEVSPKETQVHESAKELTGPVENDSEEKKPAGAESEQKIEVNKEPEKTSENKEVKEMKEARRDLSRADAAVMIQSAYRGFEVRRWQPLEKLRKIAKIREQMSSVKNQVESIKASQNELDAKQRMVMVETIMNLLLQLDSVQIVNPQNSIFERVFSFFERVALNRACIQVLERKGKLHSCQVSN